jgi:crotonobetainyl-CoA:carnitine CoA-transferase CaiB-like acyl-CoA transferase
MKNQEDRKMRAAPLEGLRVLELSRIMAGPVCGLLLSDMGADVTKVERFPGGDDARGYRRPGDKGLGPAFVMINRGKRSIALDLATEGGKATLLRLVKSADVVTENFRVGTMEKLGLSYDVLAQENPALIYCGISGYGRTGPLASQGGFDLILQAFAGLISVTGDESGKLSKPGISVADVNAGILAALGILAAYIERLKTGHGQRVDTSLLQAGLQQTYWLAAAYFSSGIVGRPLGTAHPLIAPYQTFECADGEIAIGGANQKNWERIAEVLQRPEWIEDPRFLDGANRLANRVELVALMTAQLREGTRMQWIEKLSAAGVPVGPVNTIDEALNHPQSRAIGMVVESRDERAGVDSTLGCPLHFNQVSPMRGGKAPLVGEHTISTLQSSGFSEAEIRNLLADGAAFQSEVAA